MYALILIVYAAASGNAAGNVSMGAPVLLAHFNSLRLRLDAAKDRGQSVDDPAVKISYECVRVVQKP
jgi:hypothetical protein